MQTDRVGIVPSNTTIVDATVRGNRAFCRIRYRRGRGAHARFGAVDFLISCPCGHTLERHGAHDGCDRCACANTKVAALDALIEATKREPPPVVAQTGWEAVASRRKRRTNMR